jgi:hypothetical protein
MNDGIFRICGRELDGHSVWVDNVKGVVDAAHAANNLCIGGVGDGGVHAAGEHTPCPCLRLFDPGNEKDERGWPSGTPGLLLRRGLLPRPKREKPMLQEDNFPRNGASRP